MPRGEGQNRAQVAGLRGTRSGATGPRTRAAMATAPRTANPRVHVFRNQEYPVLEDGTIDVGADVTAAAHLLGDGHQVQLNQPEQVSVLLDELAARVQEAERLGQDAPNYNLCKITVPNTNLFCVNTKGIPRVQMPQLGGIPEPGSLGYEIAMREAAKVARGEKSAILKGYDEQGRPYVDLTELFVAELEQQGYAVRSDSVDPSHLHATQNELNGAKVAKKVGQLREKLEQTGTISDDRQPIVVSGDNYILDGHHTWAATVGLDAADGKIDGHIGDNDAEGKADMPVSRIVGMDIITLLDSAHKFAAQHGLPVVAMGDKR